MVRSAKLRLQALEARHCPAAPYVGNLMLDVQANHTATIRGTVYDEMPEQSLVMIGGVADNTTASPLNNGYFEATVEVQSLGNILIQALDCENLLSDLRSIVYGNEAPAITSLDLVRISASTWSVSGTVTDEYAPGLSVRFTSHNIPGLDNLSVPVDSFGQFQAIFSHAGKAAGCGAATVRDWWRETSEAVDLTLIP